MKKISVVEWITLVLIVIGAINWGLIGLFNYNIVETIFQTGSLITRTIYLLIGLAGVYELIILVFPPQK